MTRRALGALLLLAGAGCAGSPTTPAPQPLGRLEVVVDPPDAVTVTLASTPSAPSVGQAVIFRATITNGTGVLPSGLAVEWDFDGDGTADAFAVATTATPEAPTSYDSAGQWTARVTVRGTDGRRPVMATQTITVSR
jgi:PKD repeat protein